MIWSTGSTDIIMNWVRVLLIINFELLLIAKTWCDIYKQSQQMPTFVLHVLCIEKYSFNTKPIKVCASVSLDIM